MQTIVEPKQHIDKLWGKQRIREDATYRLMKYVLRVDHDGKVLLHNVVTGRLVVLDQAEAEALNKLPMPYRKEIEQLVTEHYLVPEDYDEHQQVLGLRSILSRLDDVHQNKGIITHYTILPTTACNARCYYCFEQGVKSVTMTEETAHDIVQFVKSHCGGHKVFLSWFGGEPTLAIERIDQICSGLQSCGIEYTSEITTNGYLLDEVTVAKAKELWKLESAMICVDGTEKSYNRTKCFVYENTNAYEVVMRNIGHLLTHGIKVHLRMNFDLGNYKEFIALVEEVKHRFPNHDNLIVSAHSIIGDYKDSTGTINHGDDSWFEDKIVELNNIANKNGLQKRGLTLPWLKHRGCMAASDSSITVTAEGMLVSCPEQFGKDEWKGSLKEGITNIALVDAWKKIAVYAKCRDCTIFPDCVTTMHCKTAGNCYNKKNIVSWQMHSMSRQYESKTKDSKRRNV